jgi:hypothetical protein
MNASRNLFNDSFPHIIIHGCSAHILSLLAKDLPKHCPSLKSLVQRVNSIVNEINDSTPKSGKFKDFVEKYGANDSSVPLSLKTYRSTRYMNITKLIIFYFSSMGGSCFPLLNC